MSLLLEALKKAELAKRGSAKDGSEAPPRPPESIPPLALETEPERNEPVFTREKLPDITQPLQILSEDLPSAQREYQEETPAAPAPQTAPGPAPEPAPAATLHPTPTVNDFAPQPEPVVSNDRDSARQLFEAKEVNYNPKRPFHITLAVLALIGAGYAGYVWWQMQPRYAYSAAAVEAAAKAAPSPQAQAPAAPMPQGQTVPPGSAAQTPALEAKPVPAAKAATSVAELTAPSAPAAPGGPVLRRGGTAPASATTGRTPAGRGAQGAGARRPGPPITVTPPAAVPDSILARAWEDYQQSNLAAARAGYQQMIEREPNNRDALLGLAAIDARTRNYDAAEARYQRLLDLDPRDALAQAGLIGLRGQLDPTQSESRIKSLIAGQPEATHLYFTLGNQYALQNRWPEAQQAYFRAYSADPENADYAFNLAVSLDQMRQNKAALDYYQRALGLAQWRPTSFDRAQAAARIQELQRQSAQ